ncbi:ECF-type sigma factor [Planctomycetes bacterium K23_9]|uniref:RNA polymerase sigma factor SigL n=1 Tax=Stieleria marina TaxID=1930275 RepID=A0A517P1F8_9BACT|nr:RNA polymerase sigma factor SigL [Planctomycetes bacterium K23_9]
MPNTPASDLSKLLVEAKSGERSAREALFGELAGHLLRHATLLMQNERPDHTLQATALVNEACVRILKADVIDSVENKRQLFFAAIRAMQQVLVDHARARNSIKRGRGMSSRSLDVVLANFEAKHELSFLDLDAALEKLRQEHPRLHETITLRFFAGLTIASTAEVLSCSESRVEADWRLARAKLLGQMSDRQ